MSWWKNGLLLAAGGTVGLIAWALLYEAVFDKNEYERDYSEPERDGIKLLVEKIRREATVAMEECETDEEREQVYLQVKESVEEIKETLEKKSDELIKELKKRAKMEVTENERKKPEKHVQDIKDTMRKFADSLDETIETIRPANLEPAM